MVIIDRNEIRNLITSSFSSLESRLMDKLDEKLKIFFEGQHEANARIQKEIFEEISIKPPAKKAKLDVDVIDLPIASYESLENFFDKIKVDKEFKESKVNEISQFMI